MVDRTRNRIGTLFNAGILTGLTVAVVTSAILVGTIAGPGGVRGPIHALLVGFTWAACSGIPMSIAYALPFVIALRRRSIPIGIALILLVTVVWTLAANFFSSNLTLAGILPAAVAALPLAWLLSPPLRGPRCGCERCGYDLRAQLRLRSEHCPECGEPIRVMEPEFRSGFSPGRSWMEDMRPTEQMDRALLVVLLHQLLGACLSCLGLALGNQYIFSGRLTLERMLQWADIVLIVGLLSALLLAPIYVGVVARKSIPRAALLIVLASLVPTLGALLTFPAAAFGVFYAATVAVLMVVHFLLPDEHAPLACVDCGYDLRVQMDAGIDNCPECGAAILPGIGEVAREPNA